MVASKERRYDRFYLVLNLTAPAILVGTLVRFPPISRLINAPAAPGTATWSEVIAAVLLVAGFAGSLYLLFTRNKDELIRHYWRQAAAFTFAVLLLSPLAIGVTTGLYMSWDMDEEALARAGETQSELPQLISADLFQTLMILSFFFSFYWYKRQGAAA